MTANENVTCDLNDITLDTDSSTQCEAKPRKRPKRILHFSDGILEEYSSEDEVDTIKQSKAITVNAEINPKRLNWLPWFWYQTTWVSGKVLGGCDYMGECLANFFGITSPKYQFEINEFYRLQALENDMNHQQDLEMGGWDDQKRNNLISDNALPVNHN